jgi:hypothetical protein
MSGLDEAGIQRTSADECQKPGPAAVPPCTVLIAHDGILFTGLYAKYLAESFGLTVFTAVNETEARRYLDAHSEIAFMLIDNRFYDVNGIDSDGVGLAIAEEYMIPTILVTGGLIFSRNNPLIMCLFSVNWPALEAATRWALAMVRKHAAPRADEAILDEARAAVLRASAELYRELARERPPPAGFRPYEPIDDRHLRDLGRR